MPQAESSGLTAFLLRMQPALIPGDYSVTHASGGGLSGCGKTTQTETVRLSEISPRCSPTAPFPWAMAVVDPATNIPGLEHKEKGGDPASQEGLDGKWV